MTDAILDPDKTPPYGDPSHAETQRIPEEVFRQLRELARRVTALEKSHNDGILPELEQHDDRLDNLEHHKEKQDSVINELHLWMQGISIQTEKALASLGKIEKALNA
jgi:uncharacterized coiled-coil protein SlyX